MNRIESQEELNFTPLRTLSVEDINYLRWKRLAAATQRCNGKDCLTCSCIRDLQSVVWHASISAISMGPSGNFVLTPFERAQLRSGVQRVFSDPDIDSVDVRNDTPPASFEMCSDDEL